MRLHALFHCLSHITQLYSVWVCDWKKKTRIKHVMSDEDNDSQWNKNKIRKSWTVGGVKWVGRIGCLKPTIETAKTEMNVHTGRYCVFISLFCTQIMCSLLLWQPSSASSLQRSQGITTPIPWEDEDWAAGQGGRPRSLGSGPGGAQSSTCCMETISLNVTRANCAQCVRIRQDWVTTRRAA